MTGLGLGLPKLIISSSYSHKLMLHVLGQGLDHNVQVQVLSYPVKANRFRVWLMHCPSWTSAGFASGPPPLSAAPQAQHSALLTLHMFGLLNPCSWSFQWVSCFPPLTATLSRHKSVWKNLSLHRVLSILHVDFSTETTWACWSGSRGAMKMIWGAGAPLLWG